MAVLNGERMHDTMERLLPGARSAALLWQGAAVLGGAAAAETTPVILVTHDRTELNLLRANIINL